MTWAEFISWQAYCALEPFGEERADLRMGILASTIANCHATRQTKPFAPSDFMPKFGAEQRRRMSSDEMHATFRVFAEMHNARLSATKKAGA